ncbi:DNA primase family protein [Salinibacter ruber]|uniref:DNA primase family protein n=1 Tax=Salinibacter ruber TaxID=146919 RepID=UPI0020740273|nr:DUF5906 domain-containing protein [Salinibacter ruber]
MNDDATANANPESSASGSEDSSSSTTPDPESVGDETETDPSEGKVSDPHDKDELEEPQRQSLSVDVLRSALQAVPTDLDVDTWTRIIAAVGNGVPDRDTAESLLEEWSEEQRPGEYSRVLNETSDGDTTVAALLGIAKQNGWSPPENPPYEGDSEEYRESISDDFTLADLESILESLDSEADKQKTERTAFDLVEEASFLSDTDLEKALLILEEHGARAQKRRRWRRAVRNARKERERKQAEAQKLNRGPADLKAGEITAWIEEEVLETESFALDQGGGLFYYKDGRYHFGGKEHLNRQIKRLLREKGLDAKFTKHRCEEVLHSIETDAPHLWEKPPSDQVCLQNGVLNLKTGDILPHSPEEWLMNRSLSVKHDPTAKGDAWRRFLDSIMPPDAGAEVGFEIIARLLSLAIGRRKALYFCGGPNTGKSTFIGNLVDGIFGKENTRHISLQKLEQNEFARASLYGRRLNVCADLPSAPMKGVSVFKQITGGDWMEGERKHEQLFNFKPRCHLLFSGNGPILAPGAGEAFWDRWIAVPFFNDFSKGSAAHVPKEEIDARLQDPQEKSALLNEVLPIIREDRGITETPSMKRTLNWMRRVNEEEQPATELPTELPLHAGDGAAKEDGELRLS